MRILDAVDRMHETLITADAPRRQLQGVLEWRADVAAAVQASTVCDAPPGLHLAVTPRLTGRGWRHPRPVRFLYGEPTHRAWLDLCDALVACLHEQEQAADELYRAAVQAAQRAASLGLHHHHAKATATARAAAKWRDAAIIAAISGQYLKHVEDKIMRPVGDAIASIGLSEVTRSKRYHVRQAG